MNAEVEYILLFVEDYNPDPQHLTQIPLFNIRLEWFVIISIVEVPRSREKLLPISITSCIVYKLKLLLNDYPSILLLVYVTSILTKKTKNKYSKEWEKYTPHIRSNGLKLTISMIPNCYISVAVSNNYLWQFQSTNTNTVCWNRISNAKATSFDIPPSYALLCYFIL